MIVSPAVFVETARDRFGGKGKLTTATEYSTYPEIPIYPISVITRFKANFGLSPHHVAVLWSRLWNAHIDGLAGIKPHNLLDALFFLKVYATESVHALLVSTDEKTLRKWNWRILEAIASMPWVRFFESTQRPGKHCHKTERN